MGKSLDLGNLPFQLDYINNPLQQFDHLYFNKGI